MAKRTKTSAEKLKTSLRMDEMYTETNVSSEPRTMPPITAREAA